MASNDAVITPCGNSKTVYGEPFNFEQWIKSNNLSPIKSLMIKHNLNTIDSLSFTSPQYIQFLSDPQLFQTKSNFVSKIHKAIQSFNHANRSQCLEDFIVISEAERSVMDNLKQHMVQLDKIEKHMKQLKTKYPQSMQRINKERDAQIEQAQKKINGTFNNIKDELNKRQQHLLNELIKMKEGNINVDERKEIELFNDVDNVVKIQRNKINDNLKLCNNTVITQKNKQREKRKEFILNVGQTCDKEFNVQMQNMKQNQQKVEELISKNNEYCIKIACNINEGKYTDLLKRIHNLGAIQNSEQPFDDSYAEEKDNKVKQLQKKQKFNKLNSQNTKKIKELRDTISQWQQKYDKLTKDTTNRLKELQNINFKSTLNYRSLMNSNENLTHKYDLLANNVQASKQHQAKESSKWQKKYKSLQAECNDLKELRDDVSRWQQKYDKLTKDTTNKLKELQNINFKSTQKIKELHDKTSHWQKKYDKLNTLNKDTTNKWKELEKNYSNLMNINEEKCNDLKKLRDNVSRWQQKCGNLLHLNENMDKAHRTLQQKYDNLCNKRQQQFCLISIVMICMGYVVYQVF